eukprot:TRINITY_DN8377_c0_g1_i1.p1 TRINITY_DN8377_c0_g1~~TRINITY_DN8377_c0_g1_i1.p1  ORF type:complete len:165 (-),score=30.58 TRINITY_DN8377_c0_g1_i1:120-614(-)
MVSRVSHEFRRVQLFDLKQDLWYECLQIKLAFGEDELWNFRIHFLYQNSMSYCCAPLTITCNNEGERSRFPFMNKKKEKKVKETVWFSSDEGCGWVLKNFGVWVPGFMKWLLEFFPMARLDLGSSELCPRVVTPKVDYIVNEGQGEWLLMTMLQSYQIVVGGGE